MNKIRILLLLTVLSLGTVSAASLLRTAPAAVAGKYFDYSVTILMENNDLQSVLSQGTFQASLGSQYTLSTGYSSVAHPSEPNYVALVGASTNGINDDGICCFSVTAPNLIDRLETGGLTWKAFAEDASGSGTCNFNPPRGGDHFGFLEYSDMNTAARCANFLTTSSSSDPEVTNYLNSASPANYIWLTPNDHDNSHDTPISTGDAYLAALVPKILASTLFQTKRAALFIVYEEGNDVACSSGGPDCVYASWSGPVTKKGFTSSNSYDHYSYVHTIEDNWGLPTINSNDAGAPVMAEFFGPSGPTPLSTSFTISPSTAEVGQTVTFTATPTGGTSPYTETWNFGDGSSGSGATPTHAYSTSGTFQVSLTTSDSASPANTATSTKTLVVSQPPPPGSLSITISSNPTSPIAGQNVAFSATVTGGTQPYGVGWDFGDGGISVGLSTTHAFSSSGTFNVTAAVTDSSTPGLNTVTSKFVTVSTGTPPPAGLASDFTFSPANPDIGDSVSFATSVSGGTTPYSYAWNFGDSAGTSTGANPTYTYTSAGTFTVTLTVTDSASATAIASHSITVKTPPPPGQFAISITFSPQDPEVGSTVTFTGHQSNGATPVQWSWSFGDGNTGTGRIATHDFSTANTFTITLGATDSSGQTVSANVQVIVTSPSTSPPSGSSGSYCTGLTSQGLEPIVSVDYVNPGNSADFSSNALFDTGVTYSLAPASLATALGLTLTDGTPVTLTDLGGNPVQAYLFNLNLKIGGSLQVVNVPVAISTSASQFLIGRLGFLSQVSVTIDSSAQTVCFTAVTPAGQCDSNEESCGGTCDGDGDEDDSGCTGDHGDTGDSDDGDSEEDYLGLATSTSGGAVSGLPILLTAVPFLALALVGMMGIIKAPLRVRSRNPKRRRQ